eukprot:753234-Pelagomonas_calceolata.AAC.3
MEVPYMLGMHPWPSHHWILSMQIIYHQCNPYHPIHLGTHNDAGLSWTRLQCSQTCQATMQPLHILQTGWQELWRRAIESKRLAARQALQARAVPESLFLNVINEEGAAFLIDVINEKGAAKATCSQGHHISCIAEGPAQGILENQSNYIVPKAASGPARLSFQILDTTCARSHCALVSWLTTARSWHAPGCAGSRKTALGMHQAVLTHGRPLLACARLC